MQTSPEVVKDWIAPRIAISSQRGECWISGQPGLNPLCSLLSVVTKALVWDSGHPGSGVIAAPCALIFSLKRGSEYFFPCVLLDFFTSVSC